jgi:Uma2 family endonuclease
MTMPKENAISIEEFYEMRRSTDRLLEYIDGMVFMSPSPSTKHQRVSGRLYVSLFRFLEGTDCEVFHAPFDVELSREGQKGTNVVIPDLSVICDKSGLKENKYVGIPTLIIEILSPSNQAHDLVFKLNLYMRYGVKEYWIVNPMLNSVQVYTLNEQEQYEQIGIAKETGMIHSNVLQGFQVDVGMLFQ